MDAAVHVTQRLQHVLHFSFDLGPFQSGITASMGVAMFPEDGQDLDTLLRNADTAMYQAKNDGRNVARFFTPAMQARSERPLKLSGALDLALNNDEIFVQYQPMADVGAAPWHELGNALPASQSIDVWAQQAGMDWSICSTPVRYLADQVGAPGSIMSFEDQKVLYRSDTKAALAVVGMCPAIVGVTR